MPAEALVPERCELRTTACPDVTFAGVLALSYALPAPDRVMKIQFVKERVTAHGISIPLMK